MNSFDCHRYSTWHNDIWIIRSMRHSFLCVALDTICGKRHEDVSAPIMHQPKVRGYRRTALKSLPVILFLRQRWVKSLSLGLFVSKFTDKRSAWIPVIRERSRRTRLSGMRPPWTGYETLHCTKASMPGTEEDSLQQGQLLHCRLLLWPWCFVTPL